ncbi:asparagine synthase (glutamine-hydrolysing) [Prosthecobacter fusiformis]|uniref:asparagine synthase (glutamine-hydrolyzing) n=1 Tax=Prosthecobacter fusiformis TaxID=48464 RepID=A0A4R7ST77_9BACT|nr:asparagine synthase (glutamine-hydrolyzing) [Prosthecobacter fusiformis]TDU81696.1 asparagine synthase (glutamine-hydrolysing) [Prosthecobacter fusiformis]
MCGIAGVIDMAGKRVVPDEIIQRMSRALYHRGPDEEGFFMRPGLAMASRRLSIVGLADGQQPMHNEERNVSVVFNGELFDHVEKRAELAARGHTLVTHCDTEIIPHMWEESAEGMFEKLRGQFAIALWDEREQKLMLGRDRFGISPLYWTRQGDWLLFASEIKGLLASGMVPAIPDRRGIDHVFTFSALPGPITCFEGIQMLPPAHFLEILPGHSHKAPGVRERKYWEMDFPDAGHENPEKDPKKLVDEFEHVLLNAVDKRLRADVPVGSYLSGGVDSSMILALACHLRGKSISTYTVRVDDPKLDELDAASMVAKFIGAPPPVVQEFRHEDAIKTYPTLIAAAEQPVIDTSCASLLQLAQKVHECGQKVVLTGEGADEWLVGYPWYKAAKIIGYLDSIGGLRLGDRARRAFLKYSDVPQYPPSFRARTETNVGGPNAWIDSYGLLGLAKLRFYSESMHELRESTDPWATLGMNLDRAKHWHPLNRGIWVGGRVTLAGHLLQGKGDRVAMHSSVEVRYPFLDEDVFDFCAKLHPDWKLRGFRDKHILRLLAERWLPPSIYKRGKVIFRAPLDSFHLEPEPAYVGQLMSEESLNRTGYFDAKMVHHWRKTYSSLRATSLPRLSIEMGLAAVVATQLWHHLYIDGSLCELPSQARKEPLVTI